MKVEVDIIVPVFNAEKTLEAAIESAFNQRTPTEDAWWKTATEVHVCCFDDGSTDGSWNLLLKLADEYTNSEAGGCFPTTLHIKRGESSGRGAGFARNRAVDMRSRRDGSTLQLLCMLDSDDIMKQDRVSKQVGTLLQFDESERKSLLLGCRFDRIPAGSTSHYTKWANKLTDERLYLERFRELTVIQPTWMMMRSRFQELGRYLESPCLKNEAEKDGLSKLIEDLAQTHLIHTGFEKDATTLRLAEDLRFFHAHLEQDGKLHVVEGEPLVTYRHAGGSQSSATSRKLLLHLRARALERTFLREQVGEQEVFAIWGAGRDGKDFVKALSPAAQQRVYCFVDVDEKKLEIGAYINRQLGLNVPIVHFAALAKDPASVEATFGRIEKSTPPGPVPNGGRTKKRRKILELHGLDSQKLKQIAVVVCVAMYRSNDALENNVKKISRIEGKDLIHFS